MFLFTSVEFIFPLSHSAILGSNSIQGNTSIISGSGPQIVLWLRLWKLLLSKLLADLPVLFWAGLKRAWWDIELLMNHESGRNNRTFSVRFWLSAFKRFSQQTAILFSLGELLDPNSLEPGTKVWQKKAVVWAKSALALAWFAPGKRTPPAWCWGLFPPEMWGSHHIRSWGSSSKPIAGLSITKRGWKPKRKKKKEKSPTPVVPHLLLHIPRCGPSLPSVHTKHGNSLTSGKA